MKRILLSFIIFLAHVHANAQSAATLDSALRYQKPGISLKEAIRFKLQTMTLSDPDDTGEASEANAFARQSEYLQRNYAGNAPADSDALKPATWVMQDMIMQPNNYCLGGGGQWRCKGPFINAYGPSSMENQGRVDWVWVDPTNDNVILAASFGGVWKTTNQGHTWRNLTDGASVGPTGARIPGTMGTTCIAVNPINNDLIYIFLRDWGGMGIGVAYTVDGGDSWSFDTDFRTASGYLPYGGASAKMMYMPGTQKLFAFVNSKMLCKASPGSAWQDITPTSGGGLGLDNMITDMEFGISDPQKVIFSTNAPNENQHVWSTGHLWTYASGSGTWTDLPVHLPSTSDTLIKIQDISISATDSVFMLLGVAAKTQHLAKTALGTSTINIINNNVDGSGPGGGLTNLIVLPNNTRIFYGNKGIDNFHKSVNWGASFSSLQGNTHDDGRFITLYTPPSAWNANDDVLFAGSDGGVVMKRSGQTNFESITGDSLCITQIFGVSSADGQDDLTIGGAQDNSFINYMKSRSPQWESSIIGGDNMIPAFGRNGMDSAIMEYNCPGLFSAQFTSGSTYTTGGYSNTPYTCPQDFWNVCHNSNRPWYVDEDNNFYVGYYQPWKNTITGSLWQPAYQAAPFPDDSTYAVCDIKIAEPDMNHVLIAYRNPTTQDGTVSITGDFNNWGRLFVSTDALSTAPTWTSITPDFVRYWPIGDFEVDPNNADRIWIGLSGLDWGHFQDDASIRQHRVYYTPDRGVNWYDVSRGLPPLYINKVVYRKGTHDELYCATALGIYKCDFSTFDPLAGPYYGVTWNCFNDGMPVCNVTDLKFNYCSGMLEASTMGRGIWETPVISPYGYVDAGDTIKTNTIWPKDKYAHGAIVIEPGVTLTISHSTVHMPRNAPIIVRPGAKLKVFHSKITNQCEDCMWYGIEAMGNGGPQNDPTNYGWVIIDSSSIIEHARYGASNCNMWDSYSEAGGVIQVKNSRFVNNHVATWFAQYHNIHGAPVPTLHNNLSYFINTTFLLDNDYNGDSWSYYFASHAYLWAVEGVRFMGCDFLNRNTTSIERWKGDGIRSYDGGSFTVEPFCLDDPATWGSCTSLKRSRFCGLRTGVTVQSTYAMDVPCGIDQADFDSVAIGVDIIAANQVATTNCHFKVGTGDSYVNLGTCGQSIGIFTENSYNFKIEGNSFSGHPRSGPWYNYGVVIGNSCTYSANTNRLYRCSFDSLTYGAYAIGKNRGADPHNISATGLQITCNAFSNNYGDIAVVSDGGPDQGIAAYQYGIWSTGTGPYPPAGNTFTNYTTRFFNNCSGVTYFYNNATVDPAQNPGPAVPLYFSPQTTVGTLACPSSVSGGGGGVSTGLVRYDFGTIQSHIDVFLARLQIFKDTTYVYRNLIDLGQTKELLHAVDSIAGTEIDSATAAEIVVGGLNLVSPWVSKDLLQKFIEIGPGFLADSLVVQAFKMNPDPLKEPEFLEFVKQYTVHIDTTTGTHYTDTIMALIDTITVRTMMETTIRSSYATCMEELGTIMFGLKGCANPDISVSDTTGKNFSQDPSDVYYLADTNSVYSYLPAIDSIVDTLGTFWPQYDRIGYHYSMHEYPAVDGIMYAVTSAIPQPDVDNDYVNTWNVLKYSFKDGRTMLTLNDDDFAAIDTTTDPIFSRFAGSLVVRNISTNVGRWAVDGRPVLPVTVPCIYTGYPSSRPGHPPIIWKKRNHIVKSVNEPSLIRAFKAYPNPTSGIVTFEYIVSGSERVDITVTNALGQMVDVIHTDASLGKVKWDASKLSAGMYLYKVQTNNGLVSNGKIIVVK